MTMGPAPMIRIDLMSVRLGMKGPFVRVAPRRRSARRVEKNQTLRLGGPYRQGRRATEPQKSRFTQRRTFRRDRRLRQRRSVRTCAEGGGSKGNGRKLCAVHP